MISLKALRSSYSSSQYASLRSTRPTNSKSKFKTSFRGSKSTSRSLSSVASTRSLTSSWPSELSSLLLATGVSCGLAWLWFDWSSQNAFSVFAEENPDSEALEAEEGYKRVISAALSGNPDAQYDYAVMLYRGEGVKQDFPLAIKYFEKAAEGGVVEAMYNIGVLYVTGHRVKKQVLSGIKWLERAAALNCGEASFQLGQLYYRGEEVAHSPARAYQYFEAAAERGLRDAMFMCGTMKANGLGTSSDDSASFHYFLAAAESGHTAAACNIGLMYQHGIGVKRNLAQAFYWFRESAQLGDPEATTYLALFHLYGTPENEYFNSDDNAESSYSEAKKPPKLEIPQSIPKNIPVAIELLQKAATESPIAQRLLGAMYLARGEFSSQNEISRVLGPRNPILAYEMFAACARKDDNDCRSELASMIIQGEGVDPKHAHLPLAFKLVSKAAEEGHSNALVKKAIMQYNGIGTTANHVKAVSSFAKAAKRANPAANFFLGMALIEGDGIEKSWTYGMSHLHTASGLGFTPASDAVAYLNRDIPHGLNLDEIRLATLFKPETPIKL